MKRKGRGVSLKKAIHILEHVMPNIEPLGGGPKKLVVRLTNSAVEKLVEDGVSVRVGKKYEIVEIGPGWGAYGLIKRR